jgi:tRNA threonylcarbamoyladenosine biosynthesis protein TsaE
MAQAVHEHAELSTHSAEETRALGRALGALLRPRDFVGLMGELGAGKTELVRGVAEGAGVPASEVTSPSFALVNIYEGRLRVYHVDLFRLASIDELYATGWDDVLESEGAVLVEWVDRIRAAAPSEGLAVRLSDEGASVRKLRLEANGARARDLLEALLRTHTPGSAQGGE